MKFENSDRRYLTQRKAFSQTQGPQELWSVVDQWPLYCGIGNLSRFMAISDLFRSTLNVPGHIAEFGSWKGANLFFMAKLLRIFDPHGSKLVHCFDSFEGLTAFNKKDLPQKQTKGKYKGSLEIIKDMLNLYELEDEVVIHQGLIEQTLPKVLDGNQALTFSFVYCDTDLYDSTKTILELVHPRLAKGGLFVFDEWNYENYPGEGVAVNELLEKFGDAYDVLHVRNARQPSLAIRKR